jgi:hypothetical protein
MEIREIFDTIESDPNMDKDLQKDILDKIENIAKADQLVDGLEEKIEQHKDELSEKELKYIINKCISYKSVFYRFRNGGIVDYEQLNEITRRIFELEESIRKNDFRVWKEELLAYRGSKQDKEEDKMLKNMLMVVPEDKNVVDKVTRMFKRAIWKMQQKAKQKVNTDSVIELPQNNNLDIELNDSEFEENSNKEAKEEKNIRKANAEEKTDEELENKFGDDFIEKDDIKEENNKEKEDKNEN